MIWSDAKKYGVFLWLNSTETMVSGALPVPGLMVEIAIGDHRTEPVYGG
jgi:hypothetical protein